MTAPELISDLRACGPQSLSVTMHYIADRIHELTLADGQHLRDATDFKAALKELAEAARHRDYKIAMGAGFQEHMEGAMADPPKKTAIVFPDFCPGCGHVHADDHECQFPIGGGRICRCERAVPA
jgi:hypothetical protein